MSKVIYEAEKITEPMNQPQSFVVFHLAAGENGLVHKVSHVSNYPDTPHIPDLFEEFESKVQYWKDSDPGTKPWWMAMLIRINPKDNTFEILKQHTQLVSAQKTVIKPATVTAKKVQLNSAQVEQALNDLINTQVAAPTSSNQLNFAAMVNWPELGPEWDSNPA